jgi:hypothetical protein
LGWSMTTPQSEVNDRLANYDVLTGKLNVAGQNGVSDTAGINMDWQAVEPRVGFAWKVMGSNKTVLRAGYGLFDDSAGWSETGASGLWANPPFLMESDAFPSAGCASATAYCAVTLGEPPPYSPEVSMSYGFPTLTSSSNLANFTGTLNYMPTNMMLGRVEQFNVDVERQLPGDVVLTVSYVGARGTHIETQGNDMNTGSPTACGTVSGYTLGCLPSGQPYVPPYGNPSLPQYLPNGNVINYLGDNGDTTYNGLEIKAETKSSKYGLYALLSYTYSRTYDNGLSDGDGSLQTASYYPLPNWQSLNWELSQSNLDNNFNGSVIYLLPLGKGKRFGSSWNGATNAFLGDWQITWIEKLYSGFPVAVIDSTNNSGAFFENGGNDYDWNRPNEVTPCNLYGNPNHVAHEQFNPACFTAPADGELGNASPAPVNGPDFVDSDASLDKDFVLPWEGIGLHFRSEFFNLFNHTQYGPPIGDISETGFGSVTTSVNNPRLIQLALKLTF